MQVDAFFHFHSPSSLHTSVYVSVFFTRGTHALPSQIDSVVSLGYLCDIKLLLTIIPQIIQVS